MFPSGNARDRRRWWRRYGKAVNDILERMKRSGHRDHVHAGGIRLCGISPEPPEARPRWARGMTKVEWHRMWDGASDAAIMQRRFERVRKYRAEHPVPAEEQS